MNAGGKSSIKKADHVLVKAAIISDVVIDQPGAQTQTVVRDFAAVLTAQ